MLFGEGPRVSGKPIHPSGGAKPGPPATAPGFLPQGHFQLWKVAPSSHRRGESFPFFKLPVCAKC